MSLHVRGSLRAVALAAILSLLGGLAFAAVTAGPDLGPQLHPATIGVPGSIDTLQDDLRALLAGDGATEGVCDVAGAYCNLVKEMYWTLYRLLLPSASNALHWMYLASALLIGGLLYAVDARTGRRAWRLRDALRYLLPRSVFGHQSAVVDYKLYFINGLLAAVLGFSAVILTSAYVAEASSDLLAESFGGMPASDAAWTSRLLYTLVLVVAADLGYYLFHRLMHFVPLLWEFHKVHHSAEVLTPVTGFRHHPVDGFVEAAFTTFTLGIAQGVYCYLYGHGVDTVTLLNTSVAMLAYNLTANLRHSHIWLSYGRIASHVVSSPAQHQIHHSPAPQHAGKNMARVFSLWDWMFGTLYVPAAKETIAFGLGGGEEAEYRSLWRCYCLPFAKAARLSILGVARRPSRPAPP
jgi:sterol desaturase/sphingolipid hydroxylase (fatty acid hydroxylase superfamily)